MIGAISIKQPSTNKIAFKRRAITYGLLDTPRIKFAAKSGTCNVVKQYPKMLDVEIKINTIDNVLTQFSNSLQTPFQSRPL